jgi:hypothetical protein
MTLIEQCRAEASDLGHRWSPRDVHLALYPLGRKRRRGAASSTISAPRRGYERAFAAGALPLLHY